MQESNERRKKGEKKMEGLDGDNWLNCLVGGSEMDSHHFDVESSS